MISNIDLREFVYADNEEYSKWFGDCNINKYLGPAWTEQELIQIFNEEPGTVISAFRSDELIGVITIGSSDAEKTCIAITGIAVNPKYQRSGIGESIFNMLPAYYNTCSGQEWSAFVSHDNGASQSFLRKLGWKKGALEDNLFRYSFKQP